MLKFLFIAIIISINTYAKSNKLEVIDDKKKQYYADPFSHGFYYTEHKVKDPNDQENTVIKKIYGEDKKPIGFIRDIETTSGCDSACKPVIFSLAYYTDCTFKTLIAPKEGLTKTMHKEFTEKDFIKLISIIQKNPKEFASIKNPENLVDALSGQTLKEYQPIVVKDAAYSTLRVNMYNQHTIKFFQENKCSI
jgi:hypothetical protein